MARQGLSTSNKARAYKSHQTRAACVPVRPHSGTWAEVVGVLGGKEKGENSGTEIEALEIAESGTLAHLGLRNPYRMRDRGLLGVRKVEVWMMKARLETQSREAMW